MGRVSIFKVRNENFPLLSKDEYSVFCSSFKIRNRKRWSVKISFADREPRAIGLADRIVNKNGPTFLSLSITFILEENARNGKSVRAFTAVQERSRQRDIVQIAESRDIDHAPAAAEAPGTTDLTSFSLFLLLSTPPPGIHSSSPPSNPLYHLCFL